MMSTAAQPSPNDLIRYIRAFLMEVLIADAIKLRPKKPRVRGPLTPLAREIFHILVFHFENILTGLCNPSIATLADTVGCSQSRAKILLQALKRTEFLTWKHGKYKRIRTRYGWCAVRGSNHYQILCPHRHLAALHQRLIQAYRGKCGPLIQKMMARFTKQAPEAQPATEAANMETSTTNPPPHTAQAAPATGAKPPPEPPPAGPATGAKPPPETPPAAPATKPKPPPKTPPIPEGAVEVAGIRVQDPKLGGILSGLWEALEKRGE